MTREERVEMIEARAELLFGCVHDREDDCSQCEWDEAPTWEWEPTIVHVTKQDLFDCSDILTHEPELAVEMP